MVDITDLKSVGIRPLPVQVRPRVPINTYGCYMSGMIGSSNKIKIGKKAGEGVSGIIGKFKEEFLALIDKVVYFFQSPVSVVLMIVLIVLLIALYVGGAIALSAYFENDENYCIADIALETSNDLNKIDSQPDNYDLDTTYSYETTTQKASYKDLGIIYNGDNIKLPKTKGVLGNDSSKS